MKEFLIKFKNNLLHKKGCTEEIIQQNHLNLTNKRIEFLLKDLQLPKYDAPNESQTVKLVEENFDNKNYNLLFYLDRYWLVNQ